MLMHPELKIYPACADDLAVVYRLESHCFDRDAQSVRSLRHLLSRANAATLLARRNDASVGYVMLLFRQHSRVARLYSIAVDPAQRGQGVGEALVNAAHALALAREAVEIRLEVRVSNNASRRMFAGLGYREKQTLPGYYPSDDLGKREDGVRMHKSLLTARQKNG